jgi:hypothetical protein
MRKQKWLLRAEVPELMNIATGREARLPELDKFAGAGAIYRPRTACKRIRPCRFAIMARKSLLRHAAISPQNRIEMQDATRHQPPDQTD